MMCTYTSTEEEGEEVEPGGAGHAPSIYSQLEETRADLEGKLGLDHLLQAYQLIQVGWPVLAQRTIVVPASYATRQCSIDGDECEVWEHAVEVVLSPQTLQEEGETVEGEEFPMAELTAIVGQHNAVHCPPLIHLALADSAYSMLATPPDSKDHVDVEGVEGRREREREECEV